MLRRKIAVITGSRAEYGLLFWLMKEIDEDPDLELQVIVTGMHLAPEFGWTYRVIEEDGFTIHAKVEMLLASDTPVAIAKSIGLGTIGFADAFARLKPDIIVVLGDRYEILAATQAALVARVPIAHVHGGEASEGAIDEAIRHSVTKMSHLHFVAAEPYRQRVIQLGEDPERVFNFGAPGLDHLVRQQLLDREELEALLGLPLPGLTFLVTYHPVTLHSANPAVAMNELIKALDRFPEARVLFTKSNADTEGRVINALIDEYVAKQPRRARALPSLGQVPYLSALRHVSVVVGNSSSGLIEAPAMGTPTVNIGPRQRGRLRASSVIDCDETEEAIAEAIHRALSPEFQERLQNITSPYTWGNASHRIKEVLKRVELEDILLKRFFDKDTAKAG